MEDYQDRRLYNPPEPRQESNKRIWLLIFIPILVIIIGLVVFLFMNSYSKTIPTIDCGSNTQYKENLGNMPNFDCFIEASENCDRAKLLNTYTMEIFGIVSTPTNYMELKGIDNGKCIYYQRLESISLEYSDEIVQALLDKGATQEEIDQQEQALNESNQKALETTGSKLTCKFNQEDLTAVLNKWKEGNISIGASLVDGEWKYAGDFKNAECESSS